MINKQVYKEIIEDLDARHVQLVAVSKTKPVEEIMELYEAGQRDFGENYVQELVDKQAQLPIDIRWHFIGHLQSNKVRYIAPFVHLIQSVDSMKLLKEINKQALKNSRVIPCLLQVHVAAEETKFGFDEQDITNADFFELSDCKNITILGVMGMASLTDDVLKIRTEFKKLKNIFDRLADKNHSLQTLSMGMSSDYTIAMEEGSNMVRIGSMLFGKRVNS